MTAVHAARVAARIRKQLGREPVMAAGRYGEFKVLVDGEVVSQAGPLAFLGVLPPIREVLEAVRQRLAR